ncbi:MAG: 5-bromo-4-chloroindolyl phosphate hydrolysis family protein [Pseudomonadota bacterium]
MSQRFGRRYSPTPVPGDKPKLKPFHGKTRARAGARVNILFLLPFPFLIGAFFGSPAALALKLITAGLIFLAAWLTREGVLAEEAFEARSVAKRPALPRKFLGSVAMGAGLGLAGLAAGSVFNGLIFLGLGFALHTLSFGVDPMRDKTSASADDLQSERVAKAVDKAEQHLKELTEAIERTKDRPLEMRVETFKNTARQMFRTVEQDPRDLVAARRYLGVYLLGAKDAAIKYSELAVRGPQPQARADFDALLTDLEINFAQKTETLLADDRTALDVEIEVLRDRLDRERL